MSRRGPLILLPPSEGKAAGGTGPPWAPGTLRIDLDDERRRVMRSLNAAMRANAAARSALLGVKGDALAAATSVNRALRVAPTMPAIERYTGVLYDALDAPSLPAAPRRRLAEQVLIVSGLWGLVAPDDPIPDYKLKMGARLGPLGRLSTWWRPRLSGAVAPRCEASSRVWNLLPAEHDAAVVLPAGVEVLRVRFLDRAEDGSLVAVSHWNKLLKGALVRRLLDAADPTPEDLADWQHPSGYRLDERAGEEADGVRTLAFVRRAPSD